MNELNLQNPEFRRVIIDVYRSSSEIIVNLSSVQLIGKLRPIPVLVTLQPTISEIQRWELRIKHGYYEFSLIGEKGGTYSDVTTFDEIISKLKYKY